MGVSRLFVVVAAAALAVTIAPPALAEPRPGEFVTVAGVGESGFAGDGGDARQARIGTDVDVAVAQNGVVYIADQFTNVIRVVGTDGIINSIRMAGEDDSGVEPVAVALTPTGVLYLATRTDVRRMNPDGGFTVVAGGGDKRVGRDGSGDGGDGGPATEASLYLMDFAVAGDGTLYLADWASKRLRRVTQDGTITTVGGTNFDPGEVAAGPGGTVYFSDPQERVVRKVGPDGAVTVVLGQESEEGFAGDGGPAVKATFGEIGGIATDGAGNLYVTDTTNGNVRVIDKNGVIDTIGPSFQGLRDVTIGPNGDLYLAAMAKVVRLVRDAAEPATDLLKPGPARWRDQDPGTILPVAGAGREMTSTEEADSAASSVAVGKDGVLYYTMFGEGKVFAAGKGGGAGKAVSAEVDQPAAIATDRAGNIYVAEDLDHRIKKIDATGTVTTIAGAGEGGSADSAAPNGDGGPATDARVEPGAIAVGPDGSVYFSDKAGSGRIRKIDPHGIITTLVGGGNQHPNDTTRANEMSPGVVNALAVDASGTVYFSVYAKLYAVTAGVVTPFAGTGDQGFSGDGGPAAQARVNWPRGIAVGKDGTRYLADTENNRVRAVRADGTITTVAGVGVRADDGDGGPATSAALEEPERIAADQAGNLYVTTAGGARIRKIDSKGTITTVAPLGLVVDPDATKTVLDSPTAVCVDAAGTVYAAGTGLILAAPATGKASRLTDLRYADAMAAGPDGSVYLVDRDRVQRIYPDGAQVTVAGGGAALGAGPDEPLPDVDGKRATSIVLEPHDVAVGPGGELYLTSGSRVYRLNRNGTLSAIVDMAKVPGVKRGKEYLLTVAVRHDGVLYVAQSASHRVFVMRAGKVSTFAGTGEPGRIDERGDGDKATEAPVASPGDLAVDRDGTVYIAESEGISRVTPEGDIDTVVGRIPTGDGRAAAAGAIALDQHGNLYFASVSVNQIRVVVRPGELPPPFSWPAVWISLAVLIGAGFVIILGLRFKGPAREPRRAS